MDFQENMFKNLENIIHCSGKTNINKEINVIQIIHGPIVMQKSCNMDHVNPLGQSIAQEVLTHSFPRYWTISAAW